MNTKSSLKVNYLLSLSYQILTMITPLFTAPYVSRVLGADGVGEYSYTQSIMTYFSMLAALGTASYGIREIARYRNNKATYSRLFWEIEILSILTTMVSLVGWIIVICFSMEYRASFVALTPWLISTIFDISWFYNGLEKVSLTVLGNSICKIAGVISIFVFVKQKDDLYLYIFLNAITCMAGNMSMWLFLPRYLVKVNPQEFRIGRHFHETLIYFIPTIASSVYMVLDKTLIGIITKNAYENGYYEQASKIVNMAKSCVFVSVNNIMTARISYLYKENRIDEIKGRIYKSFDFIFFLGYGAFFGIIAVSEELVSVFFGTGYEPVITLLKMMAPLIIIVAISNCLGAQYFTPAGLRKQSSEYIIVGSIVNLILNLVLIPKFETKGAVIGSIFAEIIISSLYLVHCNEIIKVNDLFRHSYKRVLAGMVMWGVIRIIAKINISVIAVLAIEIFVGALVYIAILAIIKDSFIKQIIALAQKKIKEWHIC